MPSRIAFVMLTTATLGVLGATLAPATASAQPSCVKVTTYGSIPGVRTVGPICAPTPFAQHCRFESVSLGTLVGVRVDICVPLP
jgi:hypothetical protein